MPHDGSGAGALTETRKLVSWSSAHSKENVHGPGTPFTPIATHPDVVDMVEQIVGPARDARGPRLALISLRSKGFSAE